MSKTQIPVEKGTREMLYEVKRGHTWDGLLCLMLREYKRAERRERRAKARRKGGSRGERKTEGEAGRKCAG